MKQYIIIIFLLCISLTSCKKYLDAKPDKSLAIPATAADLQAILDNYQVMNQSSPLAGEESADTYYLTENSFNAIASIKNRNNYIWNDQGERDGDWLNSYRAVFYANVILDEVKRIGNKTNNENSTELNIIKGSSLFFRSFCFYEIAQVFAPQYSSGTLNQPGIPLRLNSDSSKPSTRGTVDETYKTIISDLKKAATLLPNMSLSKNRPSRAAAYGLLSRVYLNISDYKNAALYADSCLKIYDKLMDFNSLSTSDAVPIQQLNDEVIFSNRSYTESTLLSTSRAKIDTSLIKLYTDNDIRKNIFFKKNSDGITYQFKGSYDGSFAGAFFNGIATDEQYLILAECHARLGDVDLAIKYLNALMSKRISKGSFTSINNLTAEALIKLAITERRKELVFRGIRWSDIRRLNHEELYKTILSRKIGSQNIILQNNDKKYVALIPTKVILNSLLTQNER